MLRSYRTRWLRGDRVVGTLLAVVLAPQALAYTELAGLPAVTGLFATIV